MCFFGTLVSSRYHISEVMVLGFGRSMQLLKCEFVRFRGLALYVREVFSAYRQRIYGHDCCEVIVVRICSDGHNFYVFGVFRNSESMR